LLGPPIFLAERPRHKSMLKMHVWFLVPVVVDVLVNCCPYVNVDSIIRSYVAVSMLEPTVVMYPAQLVE
jgi:hypothetical protein